MKFLIVIDMQKDFIDGALGTKEAVAEDGLLGALSGPLASSSVGIMAAVISGLIASVFARSKDK